MKRPTWVVRQKLAYFSMRRRIRNVSRFLGMAESAVDSWWKRYHMETVSDESNNVELYLLVRATRPRHVVETGVNRGWSTTAILRALNDNDFGELTSIDLPTLDPQGRVNADGVWDGAHVPSGMTGCEVPGFLRRRWRLLIGDAKELLPLQNQMDFFFHDSEHSFAHQTFEYRTALPLLPEGGILASDDIDWSPAFNLVSTGHRTLIWTPEDRRRGAIRKGPSMRR